MALSFEQAPIALRRTVTGRERIVIRYAGNADTDALYRLAVLSERPALQGPVVLAEADGVLIAAVSVDSGHVVSDPFVASEDVVALLRLRADQLDAAA